MELENKASAITIQKLLTDLSNKSEEITHLKDLLSQTVPVIQPKRELVVASHLSPEEEIASHQLERLRVAASQRSLTLEETRMFDLLVKNKRIANQPETITLSEDKYRNMKPEELLSIAGIVNDEPKRKG